MSVTVPVLADQRCSTLGGSAGVAALPSRPNTTRLPASSTPTRTRRSVGAVGSEPTTVEGDPGCTVRSDSTRSEPSTRDRTMWAPLGDTARARENATGSVGSRTTCWRAGQAGGGSGRSVHAAAAPSRTAVNPTANDARTRRCPPPQHPLPQPDSVRSSAWEPPSSPCRGSYSVRRIESGDDSPLGHTVDTRRTCSGQRSPQRPSATRSPGAAELVGQRSPQRRWTTSSPGAAEQPR